MKQHICSSLWFQAPGCRDHTIHLVHLNLWPDPEVDHQELGQNWEHAALITPFICSMCLRAGFSSPALQNVFCAFLLQTQNFLHLPGSFHFSKERKTESGPFPSRSVTRSCRHPKTPVPSLLGLWEPPPPKLCLCQVYLAATFLTHLFKICTF